MNNARTAIAVSAIALTTAALAAPTATANHPAENGTLPAIVIPRDPPPPKVVEVQVDDTRSEALQSGSSALGGAAIALSALWLYRRQRAASS
jgi:hypothetical protein